jgi:hypothetical protein
MSPLPAGPVYFDPDIKQLFRPIDIAHMSWFCDLSKFGDVRDNAKAILGRLTGATGPVMPPAHSGGPWSNDNIELFKKWMADGCLEQTPQGV